jgi:hypothetical protein
VPDVKTATYIANQTNSASRDPGYMLQRTKYLEDPSLFYSYLSAFGVDQNIFPYALLIDQDGDPLYAQADDVS